MRRLVLSLGLLLSCSSALLADNPKYTAFVTVRQIDTSQRPTDVTFETPSGELFVVRFSDSPRPPLWVGLRGVLYYQEAAFNEYKFLRFVRR